MSQREYRLIFKEFGGEGEEKELGFIKNDVLNIQGFEQVIKLNEEIIKNGKIDFSKMGFSDLNIKVELGSPFERW